VKVAAPSGQFISLNVHYVNIKNGPIRAFESAAYSLAPACLRTWAKSVLPPLSAH